MAGWFKLYAKMRNLLKESRYSIAGVKRLNFVFNYLPIEKGEPQELTFIKARLAKNLRKQQKNFVCNLMVYEELGGTYRIYEMVVVEDMIAYEFQQDGNSGKFICKEIKIPESI